MATLTQTNLSSTNLVPGGYVQVILPFGPGSALTGPNRVLLIGDKLAAAPALDGYIYGPTVEGFTISSRNDVITNFGDGSEQLVMYDALVLTNPNIPVYQICTTESTGAAASLSITLTGTAATNGNLRFYCNGGYVDTPVSTGQTITTQAANVVSSILSQTSWQVSASSTGGVITVTAKNKGTHGNGLYVALKANQGLTGTTSSAQNFALLSGGTGEPTISTVLSVIDSQQFDYIVYPGDDPSGTLGALSTQITAQALAVPGIRQRLVAYVNGTQATRSTFAKGVNSVLCDIPGSQNLDYSPAQVAAALCGVYTAGEAETVPQLNWDGTVLPLHNPYDGTVIDNADTQADLLSGVSTLGMGSNGFLYVVKGITSYSENPSTSTLDLRSTDRCFPTIGNIVAKDLLEMWVTQFQGGLAAQNPLPGDKAPNANVVTPDILTAQVNKVLLRNFNNGLLQNIEQIQALTQVFLDNVAGRFSGTVTIQPVTLAHQMNLAINVTQTLA